MRKGRERDEEDLRKEEIERVIRGVKDEKAARVDGIASELWKYRGEGIGSGNFIIRYEEGKSGRRFGKKVWLCQ